MPSNGRAPRPENRVGRSHPVAVAAAPRTARLATRRAVWRGERAEPGLARWCLLERGGSHRRGVSACLRDRGGAAIGSSATDWHRRFLAGLHRTVSRQHRRQCPRSWALAEREVSVSRRSCSTCRDHDASSLSRRDGRLESRLGARPRDVRCSYHASQHSRCMTKPRSRTNQTPRFSCESMRRQMKHASYAFMRPRTPEHSRCQGGCKSDPEENVLLVLRLDVPALTTHARVSV